MPSDKQQVELDIPSGVIWKFISDADNWAPLVPGYLYHEKVNEELILWEFKSEIGIMKKKVHLMIHIKEWKEPCKVSFELKRKNEKYLGEGYLEVKALNQNKTRVIGFLDINASGAMGSLANSLFKKAIEKSDEEVVDAISSKIEEFQKK